MTNFDAMSAVEIAKLIRETSEILNTAIGQYKKTEHKIEELQTEITPLVEKYRKLAAEKKNVEIALQGIKPVVDENKRRLKELQHWLTRAQLRQLEKEQFDKLSADLDAFAPDMPWFNRAFKHQIDGAKRIALTGGRAILGDKRGLGKSLTALIACDFMKSKKIIIFAPKETIKNFEHEIKDWAPHRRLISMIGRHKEHRDFMLETLENTDQFVLTMNLEAWRRDDYLIDKLIALRPDTIVIDEAHFIKESKTTTFQGVQRIVHAQNMCALCGNNSLMFGTQYMECTTPKCNAKYSVKDPNCMSVKHIIPMTGTPILNSPVDLWALLNLIDEETFRDKGDFLDFYCEKKDFGDSSKGKSNWKWVFRPGGEEDLLKRLGPSMIQRDRKTAGITIPPQKIQFYEIEFDKEKYPRQYRAYRELQDQYLIYSDSFPDEVRTVDFPIVHITRSRQMMTWPMGIKWKDSITKRIIFQCDVAESIKIDKAVELAKEFIEEGERVVLFSQFTASLNEMYRRLTKVSVDTEGGRPIRPIILDGNASQNVRDRIRYDFDAKNESDEWDIVLAHYKVGGQSLNFTKATQMIIIDREWSPGKNDQAHGRIDRIGQTKETTVHVLLVDKTIDTWMETINKIKQDIVDGFEGELNLAAALRDGIQKGDI